MMEDKTQNPDLTSLGEALDKLVLQECRKIN